MCKLLVELTHIKKKYSLVGQLMSIVVYAKCWCRVCFSIKVIHVSEGFCVGWYVIDR